MIQTYYKYFYGFYVLFPLIDLTDKLFKKRSAGKRNHCVYMWMYNNVIYYIGEGTNDRPFKHENDLLSTLIDEGWECFILAANLTKMECCILEAKLLSMVKYRTFSRRGEYTWDGVSLINKQRERKYKGVLFEDLFEQYLNLDNGNKCWKALWREINHY